MKHFFILRAVSMLNAAWCLGFQLAPPADAARIGSTKIIVMTGDPAPDGNGVFSRPRTVSLNNHGQVAFIAELDETNHGGDDFRALYRGDGGPLTQIARRGDPAPNGDGVILRMISPERLYPPKINDAGEVAFFCLMLQTSASTDNNEAIYRGDGETIAKIAREGDTTLDGVGTYGDFIYHDFNNAGEVAFDSILRGIHLDANTRWAVYRGNGGPATPVARGGDAAPNGVDTFFRVLNPKINDLGAVAFTAYTRAEGGSELTSGIFRDDNGVLTELVKTGQTTPNKDGVLSTVSFRELNNLGDVAFHAMIESNIGESNNDYAIFRANDGELTQIARTGQAVPDGNGAFDSVTFSALNDSREVLFRAFLTETPDGSHDDSAIYRADGERLTLIVQEGGAAPDGNGELHLFYDQFLNDSGDVAFLAQLRGTHQGTHDDVGIYFVNDEIGLVQVAREGDAFLGSTIERLRTTGAWGPAIDFNDNGDIAYKYWLTDGRSGIAIWSIPEPSGVVLVTLLMVGIIGRAAIRVFRSGR